jgi:hypothetical protein
MEPTMQELRKELYEIKGTLHLVHSALIGNPLTNDGGMVKRMVEAEERVENIEKKIISMDKINIKLKVYVAILWAMAGSVATSIFVLIITKK